MGRQTNALTRNPKVWDKDYERYLITLEKMKKGCIHRLVDIELKIRELEQLKEH